MHKTVKVGTESAYLGTTNRGDLIKAVGLMSNKRGPRAPVELDAEDFKNRQLADFSALIVERNRRLDTLKACQKPKPFNRKTTESTPTRWFNPWYQERTWAHCTEKLES